MEFENSLVSARELRDQWLSAIDSTKTKGESFAKLFKKELDQSTKALKNKLLAVKWDFEDLEELHSVYKLDSGQANLMDADEAHVVEEIRRHIGDWRSEIAQMMAQIEDAESSSKLFNKHGITFHNPVNSISSNSNKYERLNSEAPNYHHQDTEDVVQFDKGLVDSRETSIVNNMLYDHLDRLTGSRNSLSDPSQVFNNLSRPVTTNVYMNPNENEMILDMLETEYYNPPDGLLQETSGGGSSNPRTISMFKKLLDANRNKFLGIIVFLCSFPTLLILFMIA